MRIQIDSTQDNAKMIVNKHEQACSFIFVRTIQLECEYAWAYFKQLKALSSNACSNACSCLLHHNLSKNLCSIAIPGYVLSPRRLNLRKKRHFQGPIMIISSDHLRCITVILRTKKRNSSDRLINPVMVA